MPELTPTQLTALRSQAPHTARVTWYLALAPYGEPCFTARVNDPAIAQGEMDITYNNDVGELNVSPGMTLWVGSEEGDNSLGTVRIRDIDIGANVISVAENDDIPWQDGLYICCPGEDGFRELWSVIPRITEAGGVVTFYEDYDETYSDPLDDVLPPKANAGPPVCAFLGAGGYVDISFVGEDSFTTEVGANIDSYSWDFGDGEVVPGGGHTSSDMGTCDNPVVVRFSNPGFRYVSLVVTDDTAQNRSGAVYVPVWVFDDNHPPLSVEPLGQQGKPSWRLNLRAFITNATVTQAFNNFPERALCVLFTSTEYPDGSSDIGGECHRPTIRFVGWLEEETISFDYDSGWVTFSAISHELILSRLPGFAYTLEDNDDPGDWYEVNDLNVDRALHIHLERRTTVNQVCTVIPYGEGAGRPLDLQPFPDTSIYTQAQEHLLGDANLILLSDRQGSLRVTRDPQFLDATDRNAIEVVCTLDRGDWVNDIDETKSHAPRIGYVRLGGFAYDTPLLSQAPGDAPRQQEDEIRREGYIFVNQAEANFWAACVLAKENNLYPELVLEMRGYWPVFDPAFQEYVRLTTTDPLGRNPWNEQRFIVRGVEFQDSAKDGTAGTILTLEMEASIGAGSMLEVPPPPEPLPAPPPPPITPYPVPPPEFALIYDRHVILATDNFDEALPIWRDVTGGINGYICRAECDYFDGVGAWAMTVTNGSMGSDNSPSTGLWRTDDVTVAAPVWTLVYSQAQGEIDRPNSENCEGAGNQPWGVMRTFVPVGPGQVIACEARWHGITPGTQGTGTRVYLVNAAGVSEDARESCYGADRDCYHRGWRPECGYCPESAPANKGDYFWKKSHFVTQYNLYSCHQVMDGRGSWLASPVGYIAWKHGDWCTAISCDWGTCNWRLPWPPPTPDMYLHAGSWPSATTSLQGARHAVYWRGQWYGKTESSTVGGSSGLIYNTHGSILETGADNYYCFCNMCSTPEHIYWCVGQVGEYNHLYQDGADTSLSSEFLFGSAGGGTRGIIGHIRAVWDTNRQIILVRKNRNDQNAGLNGDRVVWSLTITGLALNLEDKTGNLVAGDWWGTGDSAAGIANYDYRLDNVGFSSFETPLR